MHESIEGYLHNLRETQRHLRPAEVEIMALSYEECRDKGAEECKRMGAEYAAKLTPIIVRRRVDEVWKNDVLSAQDQLWMSRTCPVRQGVLPCNLRPSDATFCNGSTHHIRKWSEIQEKFIWVVYEFCSIFQNENEINLSWRKQHEGNQQAVQGGSRR